MTLYITIYVLIALSAAIAGIGGAFVASRGVDRFGSNGVLSFFLWTMLLAPTLRIMTAEREYLTEADATLAGYTAISGSVTWALRLSSLAIVGVAGIVIVMALIRRQKQAGGRFMVLGLVAIAISLLSSAFLGAKPSFIHQTLYTVLMLAALMYMPRIDPEQVAIQAKRVLAFLMVGSLVLAAVDPTHYVQSGYAGVIPGFNFRLHGLAPHANSLAPLALLYLILAYWVKGKNPWHLLGVGAATAVLVLAQSKTIWLTGLLMVLVIVVSRVRSQFNHEFKTARVGWGTVVSLSTFVGTGFVFLWLFSGSAAGLLNTLMADSEVSSLTGRADIWRVTLDTWHRDPWFGYGPSLWDIEFRITHHGALAAWHAHNQFLQALGEGGVVSLAAIVIYLGAFTYYAIRFASQTGGVTLALLLLILIRTITEVPIRFSVLLDATFFVHVVVFAVLLLLARQDAAKRATAKAAVNSPQLLQPT